ncbi:hypothetical protein MicloDRAFT_00040110 [Microvirga lotononidis]|uniref:Uncharacterized protein n=1 Tax=Microvirga lotononidis TaxID=864069 RepID=I4YU03_9HYPH|nr:hypothetical protein MicloDRAFT_00040110 [Microvirga lotononidis]
MGLSPLMRRSSGPGRGRCRQYGDGILPYQGLGGARRPEPGATVNGTDQTRSRHQATCSATRTGEVPPKLVRERTEFSTPSTS